jgi:cyclin-dependent kinase 7
MLKRGETANIPPRGFTSSDKNKLKMADHYIRGKPLGEGTWGQVYEAFRKDDNRRVAIKRMRGKEPQFGLDFTALREIKYLQEIKGPHIEDVSVN